MGLIPRERAQLDMAYLPAFRTGYMSILLPVETGEGEVRRIIRESVIRALTATREWPIRIHVVTSKGSDRRTDETVVC